MSSARSVEYHVEVSSRAESDLAAIYYAINANYSDAAYRWYNGLEAAVMSLTTFPNCGIRTAKIADFGNTFTQTSPTSIE